MAANQLFTISHIQWYLLTLFFLHTSRVPWYSPRHPPYSDVWWTKWLRQLSCFLVSSPLEISNIIPALLLVLVDLCVHTNSVQSARNSRISSRAWPACLRSLRASSDFCLISFSLASNTWLTASTSLRVLLCQFMLLLWCCFCAFLGMSQQQVPVPAYCLNSFVLSCLFLIRDINPRVIYKGP